MLRSRLLHAIKLFWAKPETYASYYSRYGLVATFLPQNEPWPVLLKRSIKERTKLSGKNPQLGGHSMANKTLYVGNISYSATEQSMLDAFGAYGASNVRIIEGRGFAFVDVNADQLEAAIADKNGVQL